MKNLAIFIDSKNGLITESSKRLLDFASNWSFQNGSESIYVYGFELVSSDMLSTYSSIKQYTHIKIPDLVNHSQVITPLLEEIQQKGISQFFYVKSLLMDTIASSLANKLAIPLISNVLKVEKVSAGFHMTKSVFSGKATLTTEIKSESFLVAFSKSFSMELLSNPGNSSVGQTEITLGKDIQNKLIENHPLTGSIPLPDAAIVVGAGRGFKDPSNWGIVEDLAKELGAATACSKPVSDLNWRPHHEHVGQTGVKIAPKLYIACGISGAIQHLAGVNGSRKIVVINNDSEAPFFKHADYGIVGDVFDVLPRLLNKLKSH
ncbi:electron transfer flavoprotein subunit alpha/FixB family protein [Cytophagaceae bacterium 50C-KIRBA]|uniref:Electron transfer flavoprotein subunit alpha/FixB family protein n=1 Tax=Aquirufa beregesia TaxID=2516556 RepID=A0ABX0ETT5_9BACT|nr:electron transfer flavoprotein subunit alpha/FixB family protein [Aquirufa beregesia]NGZ43160.1 electron transfer flavoprotein subunit alpha/FixB family protein [Aquirufa beregesia]